MARVRVGARVKARDRGWDLGEELEHEHVGEERVTHLEHGEIRRRHPLVLDRHAHGVHEDEAQKEVLEHRVQHEPSRLWRAGFGARARVGVGLGVRVGMRVGVRDKVRIGGDDGVDDGVGLRVRVGS
tara:strand:+ start:95 stop:475 length:381 start_codon:yes stop_codon:yes gene_type:complete